MRPPSFPCKDGRGRRFDCPAGQTFSPQAFGQLPEDTDQLTVKALQTYSDGKTVRWIEEASGGQEPENPAPVLKLTAKGTDEGASGTTPLPTGSKNSASTKSTASSNDSTARGLGVAGLVVGVPGAGRGGARRPAQPRCRFPRRIEHAQPALSTVIPWAELARRALRDGCHIGGAELDYRSARLLNRYGSIRPRPYDVIWRHR
ncbi:DUF1775 domain-containing protein [Streptomyces sp. Root369]|uniref:DUF1775 domain-containing protein n=1 Tax=Streptomyces sp. Root369 TaxID=1736523 RepID=UPI00070D1BDB|nr:hypothetical protein ASD08_45085 [Streptomyces sp. Root369]